MSEEGKEAQEGGLGKDRISAFSDGDFAIAVTLLALDAAFSLRGILEQC